MSQRPGPEVGVDLFDDGVPAVLGLGLQHRDGGVGEHGVVAVGVEQPPPARWPSGSRAGV
jgi:hypothetical protein